MLVVLSGGTGVLGRSALRSLLAAGHDVSVISRSERNDELIAAAGATPRRGDLFDVDSLVPLYRGTDAVVNLATSVPVGYAAAWSRAWRTHDLLRTTAVRNVVEAARRSGVRRVVQQSVSTVYAEQGDAWVTEQSPIEITRSTEPVAVGEAAVHEFSCDSRSGVVLRFGTVVGDDDLTRFWLKAVANRRPVGFGDPAGWSHVVHTDDLGPAVVAALHAPAGVYNVGAEPVRREDLVRGYARAAGVTTADFMGPLSRWLAGSRLEPWGRSLRVSSDHFSAQTGWRPRRAAFDANWFEAAVPAGVR